MLFDANAVKLLATPNSHSQYPSASLLDLTVFASDSGGRWASARRKAAALFQEL